MKDLTDALNLVHDYEQLIMFIMDVLSCLYLVIPPVCTDINALKTIQPRGRPRKMFIIMVIPTATPVMISQ